MSKKEEVVKSIEDAVSLIKDGQTVAIGGFGADNHRMAIVREMIREGRKISRSSRRRRQVLEIDPLIGAGCVKNSPPYVGQEMYCPIGQPTIANTRSSARRSRWRRPAITCCTRAFSRPGPRARSSLPGAGRRDQHPGAQQGLVEFIDPDRQDQEVIAVPPLRPDWAIIHVGSSDVFGNGQHLGARFGDRWIARASNRIMTQTGASCPSR